MSSDYVTLPNEIIELILLYCQTSKDYLSQSLVNRQWSIEAHRISTLMKNRFSRKILLLNQRSIIWDFDIRSSIIGYNQHIRRHGLEECVQNYHRIGGPGATVYYLQRHWNNGKLHGLEIIREINQIWYEQYYPQRNELSNEQIIHPYEGLTAIDSMQKHGRHFLVPINAILPDNCDYLGRILFQYQWNSIELNDSRQFKKTFLDIEQNSDLIGLVDFIDHIDLHCISNHENND